MVLGFRPDPGGRNLREVHGIALGRETLRLWMIEAGLWLDREQRRKRVHQPRYRRDCVGELVQVDGCEHWWFEDRGPQCTLLVFIDDATGRLMHLRLSRVEIDLSYFAAARAYLKAWGKPIAFYSDKHGVFRANQRGALGGDGMTQFGRALHALNIGVICANTSQAKGRFERAHKTLQDRLVKELRLAGARTLAEGNTLLPAFITKYNARFAKLPANEKDLHRPLRVGDDSGRRAPVGRCAAQGAPRPTPVTSVNGRDGDICIWVDTRFRSELIGGQPELFHVFGVRTAARDALRDKATQSGRPQSTWWLQTRESRGGEEVKAAVRRPRQRR